MKQSQKMKYLEKRSCFKILFVLFFCFFSMAFTKAQNVSGTVIDVSGEPLIGVSVVVKGTSQGITTDLDGKYSLSIKTPNAILAFSLIGYLKQEIAVGSKTKIDVKLEENQTLLDEVVVVGFQTQKKENLTGAISSVGQQSLENRPVANVGQALQGVVPNLNINMASGAPNTIPSFNIRGGTSLAYDANDKKYVMQSGSPLILMDGIEITETELNQMNPNDISNISVLKDASAAAIYGTRATYGVILIQTKSGGFDRKAKISYSFDISWDTPSAIPDILNSYTLMKSGLDKAQWTGGSAPSSADLVKMENMQKYLNDPRPENAYYMEGDLIIWVANTNPYKESVKDWTPMQKHNFSVSGGTSNISYYLSLGYQNQDGMYKIGTDNYKRYNSMLSVDAKVAKWFNIGAKATYNMVEYYTPTIPAGKGSLWSAMKGSEIERNIYMPVLTGPNDPVPDAPTDNILALFYAGGNTASTTTTTLLSISPEFILIPKSLKLKGDFSFKPTTYRSQGVSPAQQRVKESWVALVNDYTDYNNATINKNSSDSYAINVYADYNQSFFEKHNVTALLGINQEQYAYTSLSSGINRLLSPYIVNPTSVEDVTLNTQSTGASKLTSRAVFGRITYNYNQKYLIGMDGRYDGSSKFTKNDRFQFFPTFSAGWRISEEQFMEGTRGWLDNLKFRGSWGRLGNQPGSSYPYQATMTTQGANYILGGKYPTAVLVPGLVSPLLTWERATTINGGLDVTLLKNKLDFSFDVYERKVTDILTDGDAVYPLVLGATAPLENSGSMKGNGWELSVKWRDKLSNGLSYDIGVVLSDNYNTILHYAGNPTKSLSSLYDGQRVNDIWGYKTGGIMQESDMYKVGNSWMFNGAYQNSLTTNIYPGYVWYKDQNGDGLINSGSGTVADPGDQNIIGNSTPRYRYGITANLAYKGFDLNVFFQGVGKRDLWISNNSYWGGGAGTQWMYDRSWTPDRTDAKFPMYTSPMQVQSGYMVNGAYFRMKQAVLGYTVPNQWIHKMGIDRLRFSLAGYNLFEVMDIPRGFDPDQISDSYPQKRTIALGVQIGF